jgi:hypothetical protein
LNICGGWTENQVPTMRSFFELIHMILYFLIQGWTYSPLTTETSISQHRQQLLFRHCRSESLRISDWRMETLCRINDDFKSDFSVKFASWKSQKVKGRNINYFSSHVFRRSAFRYTWVVSEVLHTVCFLFKNEFILQNTFTGLQWNLRCALSQRSNVWESLVRLSGRLRCWCFWLLRSPH